MFRDCRLTMKWLFTSLTFVMLLVDLAVMNAYAFYSHLNCLR